MMQQPRESNAETDGKAIQAAMQFLAVLRHRKQYVAGALVVATLLGGLYYLTATRYYEGKASLLVTQSAPDVWNTLSSPDSGFDTLLPTCERLLTSAVVVDGAIRRISQFPPEHRIDFTSRPRDEWGEELGRKLKARALRRTNLIELSYLSKSPQAATAVVGAVVESYLEFMDKNHKDVSVEIVEILNHERLQIESQLTAKQHELMEFKRNVRDLGLRDGTNVVHPAVQRVVALNETLVDVQKERVQLEASLAAVRNAIRNGADLRHHLLAVEPLVGRQLIMNALGLTPESSDNANQVERKLYEDRAQLEQLSAHYGPRHPKVVKLRQTIDHAQQYLANNRADTIERMANIQHGQLGPMLVAMIEQELMEAQAHENELVEEYARSEMDAVLLNDRLAGLQIVQDEVDRLRNFQKSMLNKMTNLDINQNRGDVRIAVVSEPSASDRPVSPRLMMVAILCLMSGLGGGAAIVYVLDLLDDRFRSPEEMEDQLGVPVLAMIRSLPESDAIGAEAVSVHCSPRAVESEAFRTLRTSLAFSADEMRRVAITSCEPGDGKTTVLANLGAAYAQAGKRTLLIDADMRRPGLTRMFDMRSHGGLSQVLQSQDPQSQADQFVRPTGIENLDVLPSGSRPTDPSELLGSRQMQGLIAWAECHYDQIVIDCPPLLAASDAAILGRLADGVAVVVQPAKNHRRVILRAVRELSRLKIQVVGVVANRIEGAEQNGHYGYKSAYGYGYGIGYGYDEEVTEDEPQVLRFEKRDTEIAPRRRAA